MSEREQIQQDIEDYLEGNDYFNAPYGVLSGLQSCGKGKVRTVTFGVSRYLDATVYIFSPTNIEVRGQGGLAYKFDGKYSSKESLIEKFNEETKKH